MEQEYKNHINTINFILKEVTNPKHIEFLKDLKTILLRFKNNCIIVNNAGISIRPYLDGLHELAIKEINKRHYKLIEKQVLLPTVTQEESIFLKVLGEEIPMKNVIKFDKEIVRTFKKVSPTVININKWLEKVCNNFHPLYRNVNILINEISKN